MQHQNPGQSEEPVLPPIRIQVLIFHFVHVSVRYHLLDLL